MSELPLSASLYAILTALVEERIGIHYGPGDEEIFAARICTRVRELGFDSLLDYYYLLRYDDAQGREMAALAEALVVPETYFFREEAALRASIDQVILPAIQVRGQARVWCAACSSGEEPLTLAMMLADLGRLAACEIVATDISEKALDRARNGRHAPRSVRALPPQGRRWVSTVERQVESEPSLRQHVRWSRLNLLDEDGARKLGLFDLVLCRNVLIYFRDATVVRVVETLARALRPGGRLLVGTSESRLRFGTLLTCEERGGTFFYTNGAP